MLGLHGCEWAFFSCDEWGLLSLQSLGFSSRWLLLLPSTGFRVCGLSSCGLVALWHGDPGSGIEPVSPALTGGFITTGPPGKSLLSLSEIHIEIAII